MGRRQPNRRERHSLYLPVWVRLADRSDGLERVCEGVVVRGEHLAKRGWFGGDERAILFDAFILTFVPWGIRQRASTTSSGYENPSVKMRGHLPASHLSCPNVVEYLCTQVQRGLRDRLVPGHRFRLRLGSHVRLSTGGFGSRSSKMVIVVGQCSSRSAVGTEGHLVVRGLVVRACRRLCTESE